MLGHPTVKGSEEKRTDSTEPSVTEAQVQSSGKTSLVSIIYIFLGLIKSYVSGEGEKKCCSSAGK